MSVVELKVALPLLNTQSISHTHPYTHTRQYRPHQYRLHHRHICFIPSSPRRRRFLQRRPHRSTWPWPWQRELSRPSTSPPFHLHTRSTNTRRPTSSPPLRRSVYPSSATTIPPFPRNVSPVPRTILCGVVDLDFNNTPVVLASVGLSTVRRTYLRGLLL